MTTPSYTELVAFVRSEGEAIVSASRQGVDAPVPTCGAWTVTRPAHVNIDLMVVKPRAQAAQHKVHRES